MPYKNEKSNKVSHSDIPPNKLINLLLSNFEEDRDIKDLSNISRLDSINLSEILNSTDIKIILSVDGSKNHIARDKFNPYDGFLIKTGMISLNIDEYEKINSIPFINNTITESFINSNYKLHSTFLTFKNLRYKKNNYFDSVRELIYDSYFLDEDLDQYPLRALKFLIYKKWIKNNKQNSEYFECPCCNKKICFQYDENTKKCEYCLKTVYITDFVGFHRTLKNESGHEGLVNEYMLFHETMLLFSFIIWVYKESISNKKNLMKQVIFIKDGPLSLNSIYSKMVGYIREFFNEIDSKNFTLNLIGQEKTGLFVDYFEKDTLNKNKAIILTSDYIREFISPIANNVIKPYGSETFYGSKLYINKDNKYRLIISTPTIGGYIANPSLKDFKNIREIIHTTLHLLTERYENALYPLAIINDRVSISNMAANTSLREFITDHLEKLK